MEDVAAVLNQVAGGLQQSFGTVFERVGQSLEQSGQMMHMMNAMMEAAMLQNLVVNYDVRAAPQGSSDEELGAARFTLHVTVENRSQINVLEASVGLRIGGGAADSPASEDRALEQGLCAKSTDAVTFALEQNVLGHEGALLLRVRSPGTQQWLEKQVPFRIPVLKIARIEAMATMLSNQEGFIQAHSDGVSVHMLREALAVSAFDALLIASVGYYRLLVPAGVFTTGEVELAILIHRTSESPSGVRVAVLTPATDDPQQSLGRCRLLLEELESL